MGCALSPNITALAILRLLSGMAGSTGPSLGGSSIGDMFDREDRGKAQALYGFGPTCGPVIGGVIGGFIVYGTGAGCCGFLSLHLPLQLAFVSYSNGKHIALFY